MIDKQKRQQITALFGAYSKRLEKLYDSFIQELSNLVVKIKTNVSVNDIISQEPLYHFYDFPEIKQEYNRIFSDYVQKEMLCYRAGITDGVALAYSHYTGVLTGFSVLSDKALSTARKTAAEAFLRSRLNTPQGLSLSQLVWNYASQTKSEFEVAVSDVLADGLKEGTSAADLAREVRQYLNNPDMMYRRYHRTVVDAQGNKKDVVRWRRRIIDDQGKVRFVEQPLEKVGMGHYRSSRKNSERLMRTEINSAYHTANYERWQKEPFVIGISIELSPEHPRYDECDELCGLWPKDTLFTGFHPQCMCSANPVTLQGEEKKEFYKRLAAGEDMSNYVSPNRVKDIPESAKAWINENRDKFLRAAERGKLGYFWRNNMKYVGRQFNAEEQALLGYKTEKPKKRIKTEAEKADIQRRWDERKKKNAVIMRMGNNVWEVADTLDYVQLSGAKNILLDAIEKKNVAQVNTYARALAKEIASVNKQVKQLDVIPNAKEWLKQFSTDELKDVQKAVYANKTKWYDEYYGSSALKAKYNTLDEFLLARYKKEAKYVTDPYFLKPHELYPTAKVAENAYLQLAKECQFKIDLKALKPEIEKIKIVSAKHPKSKPLKDLVYKIDDLYNEAVTTLSGDIDALKANIAQAQKRVKSLQRAEEKALKKKLGEIYYSEERKAEALWDMGEGELANDNLFPVASDAWKKATKKEKDCIFEYTHHYCDKNEPLQGRQYMGHQTREEFERKVNNITRYIERNELPTDQWFMRGDSDLSVVRSRIEFAGGEWPDKVEDLVGMTMQEGGFMSTGSRKGGGFDEKEVIMNVFAPKGTKAAYVEPFSDFGWGGKRDWDGEKKFSFFSSEQETLFQRGTKMRITKVEQVGGKTYLDVEVIGQELKDLSYIPDENVSYFNY